MKKLTHRLFGAPEAWGPQGPGPPGPLDKTALDRRSRPGPEPTTLEAVGNQWHYALVVVQAGEEEVEEEEESLEVRL